jgi:hypothetical protein
LIGMIRAFPIRHFVTKNYLYCNFNAGFSLIL